MEKETMDEEQGEEEEEEEDHLQVYLKQDGPDSCVYGSLVEVHQFGSYIRRVYSFWSFKQTHCDVQSEDHHPSVSREVR